MKYDLENTVDVQKYRFRSEQLIKDKKFVELKAINPLRSSQQNKYLHVLVSYFATEYGETSDYVKQTIFKKVVNKEIFRTEYANKKTGEVREEWRSSAELDSGELTMAIDRFRDYASKEAGIYLPSPDEVSFLKSCEVEIARNKQYL